MPLQAEVKTTAARKAEAMAADRPEPGRAGDLLFVFMEASLSW
tara:strand:- start:347 stop:475 length:129 start_codon:yes stop_codon:yes gene_type:complete